MKKGFIYTIFSSLLISLMLVSCETRKEKTGDQSSDSAAGKNIGIIWNNNKYYSYEQKEKFKNDVEKAREKLNNKIDELQKEAGFTTGTAKANYNKGVEKLKEEMEVLNKKMSDFGDLTEENWNDFKAGVNSVWRDIEKTWKNTKNIKGNKYSSTD